MSQTLYLFVTSMRPDQYINPALHCIEYENVNRVVFTYINDSKESPTKAKKVPEEIQNRVETLLENLAWRGIYKYFDNPKKDKEDLQNHYSSNELDDIQSFYKQYFKKQVKWQTKVIEYLDLKDELTQIYRNEKNCLFDVTALKNQYVGDILAVSILEGFHNIYTFELKDGPNFTEPWMSLLYELCRKKQGEFAYRYINIVKTIVFRQCTDSVLIRKLPLKLSLLATPILIISLLAINFFYGSTSWVIQSVGILSAIASLLSILFSFYPPKK